MERIEFDTAKLEALCGIDANGAAKNFVSYQKYCHELEKFMSEAKGYLRGISSSALVSDSDVRAGFLAETKRIRTQLDLLGMKTISATIAALDSEVYAGIAESVESRISEFYSEIESMLLNLAASQSDGEKLEPEAAPQSKTKPSAAKPLILAVDDKPELLTAVVNMLEDRFRVMAATNGRSVLKVIEKHSPELFLLDIEMPNMDGHELADQIRRHSRFKETPIIFLTSQNTLEHVMSAINKGVSDYILKPVNKELLVAKISQHLSK